MSYSGTPRSETKSPFGEVDEMPHPGPTGLATAVLVAGHLEDLPARRGHGPHMGHVAVVTWAAQDWVGLW
jgi:hypothetical protein